MRLHLVSLPHTRVESGFCGCAYTAKVLKFARMMGGEHEIFLYAPEGDYITGAKLIPCLTNEERIKTFGADDPARLPTWPSETQTVLFNLRVVEYMRPLLEPHDLILLSGGWTHHAIRYAFPNHIHCEPGVGYEGIMLENHIAFESYAWQHHVYAKKGINDGRFFDTVIPNYFDPEEFPILNNGKGDYLLFLGRVVLRKGPHIASEIAKASGMKLKVAGAGGKQVGSDIVAPEITVKDAEYVGPVNVEERAKLLAEAKALLFCTTYIEPFGGVMVEAMMAGTPVIATDWGAPTEVVAPQNGFRFRSLREAVEGVERVGRFNPREIRKYAVGRYSLKAVAPQFNRWFSQLQTLWDRGWYQT